MLVEAFIVLLRIPFLLALASLSIGFVHPVYLLWFLDRYNRLKVMKVYGTLSLLFYVLYLTLKRGL